MQPLPTSLCEHSCFHLLSHRVRSCSADCVLTMLPWYVYFQFTILAFVKEEIHTICPRPNFSDVFYSFAGNVPEYLGKKLTHCIRPLQPLCQPIK